MYDSRFLPVSWVCSFFFFFKQKTAYEIMPSLVGSEMCIRDRVNGNIGHIVGDAVGDLKREGNVVEGDLNAYGAGQQDA